MRSSEIELRGEDWPGSLSELPIGVLTEGADGEGEELRIFVWADHAGSTRAGVLLEAFGNRTVKLTGQYSFRYDPPRTASTGSGRVPTGDCHLYSGGVEIAAWDATGKARHGYAPGHPLPRKAYDAIVARYPEIHGLKGRLLECCVEAVGDGRTTLSFTIGEQPDLSD